MEPNRTTSTTVASPHTAEQTGPPRLSIAVIMYLTASIAGYLAIVRVLQEPSPLSYVQTAMGALLAFVPLYGYWWFQKRKWAADPGEYLLWVAIIYASVSCIELATTAISVESAASQRSDFVETFLGLVVALLIWFILIDIAATLLISLILGYASYRQRKETTWFLFFLATAIVTSAKVLLFLVLLLNIEWIEEPFRESGLYDIVRTHWSVIGGTALLAIGLLAGISIVRDLIRRRTRNWLHWVGICSITLHVGEIVVLKGIELTK